MDINFGTWRIRALIIAFFMFIGTWFFHYEGSELLPSHWTFFLKILCPIFGILFILIAVKGD